MRQFNLERKPLPGPKGPSKGGAKPNSPHKIWGFAIGQDQRVVAGSPRDSQQQLPTGYPDAELLPPASARPQRSRQAEKSLELAASGFNVSAVVPSLIISTASSLQNLRNSGSSGEPA